MELTSKQQKGLSIAVKRYLNHEKYTVIGGFAGAGKSTLVKFIVDALVNLPNSQLDEDLDIGYACFTGKAAQILIDKGNKNAVTLHKLMYKAKPMPNGGFKFEKKMKLDYKIIIVDECSMAPAPMVNELLNYNGIYVIFCGDPAQLPPISKDDDNHLLDHPHIFLDEIMRQAQDSGIIRLSMDIREGKNIDGFKSNEAIVLPKKELSTGMLTWADQILCATNATRRNINTQCRQLYGFTEPIEENEKIICLKNEWGCVSYGGNALTNGCIGTLTNSFGSFYKYPYNFCVKNNSVPILTGHFVTDTGDDFGNLDLDKQCLVTGESYLSPQQKYKIKRSKKYNDLIPFEFTYGYCITTWKAQGSEFEKVLAIEEGHPFDKLDHQKYLYTAVTRASDKAVLVRS